MPRIIALVFFFLCGIGCQVGDPCDPNKPPNLRAGFCSAIVADTDPETDADTDTDTDTDTDMGSDPDVDDDHDGVTENEGDCDDTDPNANPAEDEVCDGVDNNCSGEADEGLVFTFYRDSDRDGYGNSLDSVVQCSPSAPPGYVSAAGDCDDGSQAFHPGAAEDCEDTDDYNCDGSVGRVDADKDGYAACEECADDDEFVHPGAKEVCDLIDNDCDGEVNEGVTTTFYEDLDGDGVGVDDEDTNAEVCSEPGGYASVAGDCDDEDPTVSPLMEEVCDDLNVDEDCNGQAEDSGAVSSTKNRFCGDADCDTYSDGSGFSCLTCDVEDCVTTTYACWVPPPVEDLDGDGDIDCADDPDPDLDDADSSVH
jgi:hypothetical protein